MEDWTAQLAKRQYRMACRIAERPYDWPSRCVLWRPPDYHSEAYRSQGRPRLKWDSYLTKFAEGFYGTSNWLSALREDPRRQEHEQHFVNLFTGSP